MRSDIKEVDKPSLQVMYTPCLCYPEFGTVFTFQLIYFYDIQTMGALKSQSNDKLDFCDKCPIQNVCNTKQ